MSKVRVFENSKREIYFVFGNELRWRWWQREKNLSQEFRRLKINPEKQGFRKEHKNLSRERESCGIIGSWSFYLSENTERVGCFYIQTVVSLRFGFFFFFLSCFSVFCF